MTQRWNQRTKGLMVAVLCTATIVFSACGAEKKKESTANTAETTEETSPTGEETENTSLDNCSRFIPGELLSSKEAVVTFDEERVCPGYVTVLSTTAVTWRNTSETAHTLQVRTRTDAVTVTEETIQPGEEFSQTFDVGVYDFTTDAIPSFVGSIEVQ